MGTYLGEDGGGEAGDDAAAEGDGELARASEVLARLLGHAPEDELVAELVHRELPDGVRDLPAHVSASVPRSVRFIREEGEGTYLQRMGRKPA